MTRFMGGVSSADQTPGAASAGTVEQSSTAIGSEGLSTDAHPEVAPKPKPEVARKPVIVRQATALAPTSQIRAGGGTMFPPSDQSREGTDNRSTVITHQSAPTGTGNTNPHDVTKTSVEERRHNAHKCKS